MIKGRSPMGRERQMPGAPLPRLGAKQLYELLDIRRRRRDLHRERQRGQQSVHMEHSPRDAHLRARGSHAQRHVRLVESRGARHDRERLGRRHLASLGPQYEAITYYYLFTININIY